MAFYKQKKLSDGKRHALAVSPGKLAKTDELAGRHCLISGNGYSRFGILFVNITAGNKLNTYETDEMLQIIIARVCADGCLYRLRRERS